jgi:hypothetical protein
MIVGICSTIFAASTRAATSSQQKLRKSETVVAWYQHKGRWHLRPGFAKCSQIKFDRPAARCYKHRLGYRWHKQRIERLRPKPTLSHLAGWLCIHSREGAWNANTGNGYYGGLQMTYGWLGLIRGAASDMSPMAQMAAAEGGYLMSGYSSAWLAGQWPNTYPPCAHLFE